MYSKVMKEKLYRVFDRPRLRLLMSCVVSAYSSLRVLQPCWVQYQEKEHLWIQEYADGVLVEPRLRLRVLPQIVRNLRDMYLFEYTPQPGDIVFDIGAGTGWETLYFSRLVGPEGHVVAVEAHPKTFACLSEMCRRNKLQNVTLIHGAVAADDGKVVISDDDHHTANTIVDASHGIEVKAVSLNTLIGSMGFDQVDFLKMNIEGAERMALEGTKEVIRRVRHLSISCHDFLADLGGPVSLRTTNWVVNFLDQNGFNHIRRAADPRPWVRDCVYGHNRQIEPSNPKKISAQESKPHPACKQELEVDRTFAWKENV